MNEINSQNVTNELNSQNSITQGNTSQGGNQINFNTSDNPFGDIGQIIKKIQEYPSEKIEDNLAQIHIRVDEVFEINRIEEADETGRKNPAYYPLKMLKKMHADTADEYTKYYPMNDINQKLSIMGKLYTMDQKLIELEKGNESDE
ncbi:hypothetical protein [Priestia megaterium]|uniref:hypothetical protein n=1 Tax=Priestia megaterium TaxID=1404 RepID=UPI001F13574F|nr:hypothetical protein [Priestia megaterium]UMZ35526.1 hypothetical protein MGJ28_12895 [Priestia megaterium]